MLPFCAIFPQWMNINIDVGGSMPKLHLFCSPAPTAVAGHGRDRCFVGPDRQTQPKRPTTSGSANSCHGPGRPNRRKRRPPPTHQSMTAVLLPHSLQPCLLEACAELRRISFPHDSVVIPWAREGGCGQNQKARNLLRLRA
jgi:hypothetical protein